MRWLAVCLVALGAVDAQAAVVRGRVTTPLGVPLAGARVQLIYGTRDVADTVTAFDGSYEVRTALSGRFVLIASSSIVARPAVQVSLPFYAGSADVLRRNVVLEPAHVEAETTNVPLLLETPFAQLADAVRLTAKAEHATLQPVVQPLPSVFSFGFGPTGAPAVLLLRGAGERTVKAEVDGLSAEDLGGGANVATLPPLDAELVTGAQPVATVDAEAGVLALRTPWARTLAPSLTLGGDLGSLDSLRTEATGSATAKRADVYGSFADFKTHNEGGKLPFQLISAAVNTGYHISGGTVLRFTLRREVASARLPVPFAADVALARRKEQNLYGAFTFSTVTVRGWQNLVRAGVVRRRAQTYAFAAPADRALTLFAPGATVTGRTSYALLPSRADGVTDRDELHYETSAPLRRWLAGAATFRYQDERGANLLPAARQTVERHHLGGGGALRAETLHHRLMVQAAGSIDGGGVLPLAGAPAVGLVYVPVEPGGRRLRGTVLRATAAAGYGEPTLAAQAVFGNGAARPRSRTFSAGVEQTLTSRWSVRGTYFHGQFAHQEEMLGYAPGQVATRATLSNGLAYRTQGLETTLDYTPGPRLHVWGGYTYLAALTEQTAAGPAANPALPGVAIGAYTALAGARPFYRPPHTGFVRATYTGPALSAALEAVFAGRSDGSSGLVGSTALLLPNRNLNPGWTALNASASYAFNRRLTVYVQLENLLDDRQMAPFGFMSSPRVARGGLRIHLGGE